MHSKGGSHNPTAYLCVVRMYGVSDGGLEFAL